ncbi:hypothetical protein B0H67DRAFT_58559 [Lasiosphaeris hirsuta]|uniref:Uncharacterized protein n=1 Tax=Lasiosphaeris hirsuta TaxID=260670 RepID=A0AA40BBB4_9PEZI|nr:hypothetical protein B0H67DRAFT_58559 [Lasiosphaeris hirsuta]
MTLGCEERRERRGEKRSKIRRRARHLFFYCSGLRIVEARPVPKTQGSCPLRWPVGRKPAAACLLQSIAGASQSRLQTSMSKGRKGSPLLHRPLQSTSYQRYLLSSYPIRCGRVSCGLGIPPVLWRCPYGRIQSSFKQSSQVFSPSVLQSQSSALPYSSSVFQRVGGVAPNSYLGSQVAVVVGLARRRPVPVPPLNSSGFMHASCNHAPDVSEWSPKVR